jgi:hypothetical protein
MKKVFIGGSRRFWNLPQVVCERLDGIIAQSFTVLVGDANGTDKAIQKYLAEKGYKNVIVFCAGDACRNNIGNWKTNSVEVERSKKDYRFYMKKDLEMAKEADFGFMIWDRQSSGTLSNILELLERGKNVLVYIVPEKKFVKLGDLRDLYRQLKACSPEAMKSFDIKLNLKDRIQMPVKNPQQLQMFPDRRYL